MRKTTFALGLGLALSVGAADLAAQQQPPRPDSARAGAQAGQRGMKGQRGMPGRPGRAARGGHGALLRGITLTDAQKAQLRTMREEQRAAMQAKRPAMQASRDSARKVMEGARAARQRGDTAALRAIRTQRLARRDQRFAQMAQAREQHIAAIRAILTPEQRVQFDRNVAEMKQRGEQRKAGGRPGRGPRGGGAQFRGA